LGNLCLKISLACNAWLDDTIGVFTWIYVP
jgi:hypothetical protein